MDQLPAEVRAVVRNYEPVFRSMLEQWLLRHADATGTTNFTMADVTAGVSHVFSSLQHGRTVECGSERLSLREIRDGQTMSARDVLNEIAKRGMVA